MKQKIAVVTGVGRLAGIGRAICIALAEKGVDIFFTYWSPYDQDMPWNVTPQEPEQIRQQILALGRRCEAMELDLSSPRAEHILLDQVKNTLGAPTILVNNATYSTQTTVEDITADELDKHYTVNMRAATMLTVEFARRFEDAQQGRIINLSSGQSLGPMPDEIAYAITKGAIETLTYTLAPKLAEKGITINAVNPGPNDTGWMDNSLAEALLARFPMNRLGKPKDTANLIAFLITEEAEWITGQVIHSEGGFRR